ncbi:hypothetical protein FHX52_1050 [Humibacillus xanthopallidus]|uniref:Uncharacterized protein n=1 Tax=Humibacillus xanthopallidus TaxID=412689 RepID=A0A543PV38_9MICO|nr:hypothetical protein [Humibacillus xanthopallidus]TQN47931.1 hypothetical protein FHX52_1050 [Humibacillus xanthopallidus]
MSNRTVKTITARSARLADELRQLQARQAHGSAMIPSLHADPTPDPHGNRAQRRAAARRGGRR